VSLHLYLAGGAERSTIVTLFGCFALFSGPSFVPGVTGADATDPSAYFKPPPRPEEKLRMSFQHSLSPDVRDSLLKTATLGA
jgi:hypothetical protein